MPLWYFFNMSFLKKHLFTFLSWFFTFIIVAGIFYVAYTKKDAFVDKAPPQIIQVTATPSGGNNTVEAQEGAPEISVSDAIRRKITLKTRIPTDRPNYQISQYTVARGDSTFSISKEFNIEPETILWANYDLLEDNPDSLRVGQELNIPPVDGIYYKWQEDDTIENVADEFKANAEDILNFSGNDIDLTNPTFRAGEYVMIPGGSREFKQWVIVAPSTGGSSSGSGSACPAGAVGSGYFSFPTYNHYLTGNDYWSGHLGIDLAADTGASIYAADGGVVTMAQGGYNYGYGNVIAIDHGNGYSTLYAHLSQINVVPCQSVYAGTVIGYSGNTGNSFGAHLHFEIRYNGAHINPWSVLP